MLQIRVVNAFQDPAAMPPSQMPFRGRQSFASLASVASKLAEQSRAADGAVVGGAGGAEAAHEMAVVSATTAPSGGDTPTQQPEGETCV